jgi:hypothetical protein
MKRMKGNGKNLSRNKLKAPTEIKTWKTLVGLERRENGVMILTLQHIPLMHTNLGTRKEIKT